MLTNNLKEEIRQGWVYWNIDKHRLESIAEHAYGVSMLAIAIDSEYDFDINIERVIKMLVLHELEEIIIGDMTPIDDVCDQEKLEKGRLAVSKILGGGYLKKKSTNPYLTNLMNKVLMKQSSPLCVTN